MKKLAALLSALEDPDQEHPALLAAYLSENPAAEPLLTRVAPPALISPTILRDWIAEATGLPNALIEASRRATGDLIEALALILPGPIAPPPSLDQVLADLTALPPGPLAKSAILSTAFSLPVNERTLYFRLITGTLRLPLSAALLSQTRQVIAGVPTIPAEPTHQILAVMIYAQAALTTGARGPEITLAVWDGPALVPITRARANLPKPQISTLMAWIRSSATGRFGPLRAVPAQQVFRLGFTALTTNARRKSKLNLTGPRILDWLPDAPASDVARLHDLTVLLPNTA